MPLHIPEDHRDFIQTWVSLGPAGREAFLDAARGASPQLYMLHFEKDIAKRSGLETAGVRAVLTVLNSLLRTWELRPRDPESLEAFLEEVVDAVRSTEIEGIGEDKEVLNDLREFVSQAFSIHSIIVTSRANDILLEHERPVTGIRLLTDYRPIFSLDDSIEPMAGLIVHNLKIETQSPRGREALFFALDESDLRTLKDVVDRALAKARNLRRDFRERGLDCIQVPGGDE